MFSASVDLGEKRRPPLSFVLQTLTTSNGRRTAIATKMNEILEIDNWGTALFRGERYTITVVAVYTERVGDETRITTRYRLARDVFNGEDQQPPALNEIFVEAYL